MRHTKRLTYEGAHASLTRDDLFKKSALQLSFGTKQVYTAHIGCVTFRNTGNVDLRRDDFEGPIVIKFGKRARIIDYALRDHRGRDMDIEVRLAEGGILQITPFLLKKKQLFFLHYQVIDDIRTVEVVASLFGGDLAESKQPWRKRQ